MILGRADPDEPATEDEMQFTQTPYKILAYGQRSVTDGATAVTVPATASNGRTVVALANNDGSNTIYIGNNDSTTNSTGFPVFPKASISLALNTDQAVYVYASGGNVAVSYIELGEG